MLSFNDFLELSEDVNIPAEVLEKDYVISWVLKALSEHDFFTGFFALSGETALQKVYFENYRFCSSIDLSYTELPDQKLLTDSICEICSGLQDKNRMPVLFDDISFFPSAEDPKTVRVRLTYMGPKYEKHRKKNFFINMSEKTMGIVKLGKLEDVYDIIYDVEVPVLSLEEIYANLAGVLTVKNRAEDLFDAWYIGEHAQLNKRMTLVYISSKVKKTAVLFKPEKKQMLMHDYSAKFSKGPDFETVYRQFCEKIKQIR